MADIAASVLAKLKNKAKTSGISYQQCLQLFFQEEFLRKLAGSKYAENFVLKGGLFIYTLTNFESRATVDVDFLMRGLNNDLARMDEIIQEILAVDTGNDFVTFKASKTEPIAVQRKYHGISTQITGYIKNVRVPFNVDIGVGDVIVPKAERRNIQTQLDGYEKPEILTYSLESTIAEKFDAILQRLELTGRMKDFYDIYYLSRTFDFDGLKLQTAIQKTLQNRGTAFDRDSFDRVLALAEDESMQTKWRFYLKTLGNPELSFEVVVKGIQLFLKPVWDAILEEDEFSKKWQVSELGWASKWERAMKHQEAIDKKLTEATAPLAKLLESSAFAKLTKVDDALLSIANAAAVQTQQISKCFASPAMTGIIERLNQIDQFTVAAVENAAKLAMSPEIQVCLGNLDRFQRSATDGAVAALSQMSDVLRACQSSSLIQQVSRVMVQIPSVSDELLVAARAFDFSKLEVKENGVLAFDGVDYSPTELAAELDSQVAVVEANKPTLREKFDILEQKLWLLLLIVNLIVFIPQIPETVDFYTNVVSQIQEIQEEKSHICFTIKDRSVLREQPNSGARRLLYLQYDTALEIIDDIPRWYQVKYADKNGVEIIGWISKISVEVEE